MNIFKKFLGFVLSGTLAISTSICTTANAAPNLSVSDSVSSIVENNKNGYYTSYKWEYVSTATSPSGTTEEIYDIYGKVDTKKADLNNFDKIASKLPEEITKITARKKIGNNTYVYARVISFESGQVAHARLAFPVNGSYEVVVYASTGTNVDFDIEVTNASSTGNKSDSVPPELNLIIPDSSEYVPGKKVSIKAETNEICNINVPVYRPAYMLS